MGGTQSVESRGMGDDGPGLRKNTPDEISSRTTGAPEQETPRHRTNVMGPERGTPKVIVDYITAIVG